MKLAGRVGRVWVWLDRRESLVGSVELAEDVRLDVVAQWGVGPGDEFLQYWDQRSVFAGQLAKFGAGGVDQADAVVGEVGCLDDQAPGVCRQAGCDVVAYC
jgi:hypothetical protein